MVGFFGQKVTDEKSNEITALPKLLELKDCIVTIDAIGCQRDIAGQIIGQEGDYSLGLKGNQGALHEATEDFFKTAQAVNFKGVDHSYHEEIDKGHGQLETRRYWLTEALCTLPKTGLWKGLRSIGMVERKYLQNDKLVIGKRYFIHSFKADANVFATAVRGHWAIENRLQWCLDVPFREDESRIRKGNAPAIMTAPRHICLTLFQKHVSKPSVKNSVINPH